MAPLLSSSSSSARSSPSGRWVISRTVRSPAASKTSPTSARGGRRVEVGGRLVEHEHGGVASSARATRRAGAGRPRALARARRRGCRAPPEARDPAVQMRQTQRARRARSSLASGGRARRCPGCVAEKTCASWPATANVAAHVLLAESRMSRPPIVTRPSLRVEEPQQQVRHRRLPGAARPDERDAAPRLEAQVDAARAPAARRARSARYALQATATGPTGSGAGSVGIGIRRLAVDQLEHARPGGERRAQLARAPASRLDGLERRPARAAPALRSAPGRAALLVRRDGHREDAGHGRARRRRAEGRRRCRRPARPAGRGGRARGRLRARARAGRSSGRRRPAPAPPAAARPARPPAAPRAPACRRPPTSASRPRDERAPRCPPTQEPAREHERRSGQERGCRRRRTRRPRRARRAAGGSRAGRGSGAQSTSPTMREAGRPAGTPSSSAGASGSIRS